MKLLVVESPNKIKKIEHLLGNGYKVVASVGHIMDLDPNRMSVEIENEFKPIYINKSDKAKVISDLKYAAKNASEIILATDEDREGEMIAWSIAEVLKLKNPKRITFNAITKAEIDNAIKNPRTIDNNMVNAQQARRILDRLAGYELSPLLDKQFGQKKLSAGRVQSVVGRLFVDRENEIKKFMSNDSASFFRFKGTFISSGKTFKSNLHDLENKNSDGSFKGGQSKIDNQDNSREFLNICIQSEFKVEHVFDKKKTQGPSPPFTTSTLQQDANRKFGFSVKRTMTAAQHLYEEGHITYMRTDSVSLSEEALENIKKYVVENYGNNYYRRVEYKAKTKNTQEAHEAIRPTDVYTVEIENSNKINDDEKRLYNLIWKRSVASQMKPAEYNVTSIQISISKTKDYYFMTNIENLTFAGFLAVYNIENLEEEKEEDAGDGNAGEGANKNIKIPKVGAKLDVDNISGVQEFLKPPGRYNQASLIDKLDPKNLNIGRPATYASIIEKLLERKYVEVKDIEGKNLNSLTLIWKKNNKNDKDNNDENTITENINSITLGKEKNKFVPTYLGIMVTNFLVLHFPKLMDYKFTATMEDKLDDVANGDLEWKTLLKEFYDEFHPLVMKLVFKKPEVEENTRLLGIDSVSGFEIYATIAKWGPVVKLMVTPGKPRCVKIVEPLTIGTITLDDAQKLLKYPIELGKFEKKALYLNKGPFGFYVSCGDDKANVVDENVTIAEAIEAIKKKKPLATFTKGTKKLLVLNGQYNKYISVTDSKTKKTFTVPLPEGEDTDSITLERIDEIIMKKFSFNKNNDKKTTNVKKDNESSKTTKGSKVANKKIVKKIAKKAAKKNIILE